VVEGDARSLVPTLGALVDPGHPVSVGRTPTGLVVRAHHAYVDGLGLLAVLAALLDDEVVSGATGIGERERRSTVLTMASRLLELAVRPPAPVASGTGGSSTSVEDVFAVARVPRAVRTAQLAHAAVQAVAAHNGARGARSDRVALAVGVSTTGGADLRPGDHSGFLRFTGAERLGVAELEQALATGPLQVGGTAQGATARRAGGLIRWASRVFAGRLGSTVLVSHLGRVEATGLSAAEFYPLAGNGSGLSVGAATAGSTTTVTLRARARQHDTTDLEALLAGVLGRLT
jgi:hypothetical protein